MPLSLAWGERKDASTQAACSSAILECMTAGVCVGDGEIVVVTVEVAVLMTEITFTMEAVVLGGEEGVGGRERRERDEKSTVGEMGGASRLHGAEAAAAVRACRAFRAARRRQG